MFNIYRYIQAFSLDIAFGGVIGAAFLTEYLDVGLDFYIVTELFLVIWLIYTFDHLIDSSSPRYELVSLRHKIHHKFSTTIWGIWTFTIIVAISLLFKIPANTLMAGSILAVFVAAYFISLRLSEERDIYHKEVLASVIYASGIFIGPLSISEKQIGFDLIILFTEYALLAAINLFTFSIYERAIDRKSGFQSLLKSIGVGRVQVITITLLMLAGILSIGSIIFFHDHVNMVKAQVIVLIMVLVLAVIYNKRRVLAINQRYRIAGDATFFIPVFYFIF